MKELIEINEVLSSLDACLLIRQDKLKFKLPSKKDSWIYNLKDFSKANQTTLTLQDDYGFLSSFLIQAEELWHGNENGKLESGYWSTSTKSGEESLLDLIALKGSHPDCLLVRRHKSSSTKDHLQEARDILLRREKLESNILLAESQLVDINNLLESFPDTMLRCEEDGTIIKISSKHEAFQEAQNIKQLFTLPTTKRVLHLIKLSLDTQKLSSLEYSLDNQCFEVRLKALSSKEALLIVRDISEQKRTEIKLREARISAEMATKTKSTFLANMSHEIRTPMNGINGLLELLLDTDVDSQQKEYLELMQRSSNSLLFLINDILDLSKVEAGKIQIRKSNFKLLEEVKDIVNLLKPKANEKGIELKLSSGKNVPAIINSDKNRFRQVLLNLTGNAIKFTEQGSVSIILAYNNDYLHVSVEDTGAGIEKSEQEKLFQAFEQASNSVEKVGTGLGLSISKNIIELLGGKIFLKSEVNKGTQISFSLGDIKEKTDSTKTDSNLSNSSSTSQAETDFSNFNILLVEDNLVNQKVVEGMLKKTNVKICVASTGNEALEKFNNKTYDAILMDCNLPEKDGFETTTIIRQSSGDKQKTPIIGVTASAMIEDKDKCFKAGMNDFLTKPIQSSELISALNKWLTS